MKKLILNRVPVDFRGQVVTERVGKSGEEQYLPYNPLGVQVIGVLQNSKAKSAEQALKDNNFCKRVQTHLEEGSQELEALMAPRIADFEKKVGELQTDAADKIEAAKIQLLESGSGDFHHTQRNIKEELKRQIESLQNALSLEFLAKQVEMTTLLEVSDEEYARIELIVLQNKIAIVAPFLELHQLLNA